MASNLRSRRSIAHRVVPVFSDVIDLTTDSPNATIVPKMEPKELYEQLKEIEENQSIVRNKQPFFCINCTSLVGVNDGIAIRNCLHDICITCARNLVFDALRVEVKCPAHGCEEYLQDREVRGLLTQPEYSQHINQKILNLSVLNNNNNKNDALYKELQALEDASGYIPSINDFECEICCMDIQTGDGVMIRECLHQYCIDCIRSTINTSEEAEVMCPATSCEHKIQDREIRSLLTQAEFDKYSMKVLRIAESKTPNSFHCKKANCTGWAICEDNVNFFRCPICASDNCLTCQAIHPGLNCAQYQENLKYEGMNDDERSAHKLDEIVKNGLGMRCPTCKIVIMKREGCDGLMCSMCKTELCWATK